MSGRTNRPLDRAADLRTLEILRTLEKGGTFAARQRFGLTNSAVQGLRGRFLRPVPERCTCTKPENKDGGMPDRWWAA